MTRIVEYLSSDWGELDRSGWRTDVTWVLPDGRMQARMTRPADRFVELVARLGAIAPLEADDDDVSLA